MCGDRLRIQAWSLPVQVLLVASLGQRMGREAEVVFWMQGGWFPYSLGPPCALWFAEKAMVHLEVGSCVEKQEETFDHPDLRRQLKPGADSEPL